MAIKLIGLNYYERETGVHMDPIFFKGQTRDANLHKTYAILCFNSPTSTRVELSCDNLSYRHTDLQLYTALANR